MNIFGGGNTTFGATASTNFNAMKDIEVSYIIPFVYHSHVHLHEIYCFNDNAFLKIQFQLSFPIYGKI